MTGSGESRSERRWETSEAGSGVDASLEVDKEARWAWKGDLEAAAATCDWASLADMKVSEKTTSYWECQLCEKLEVGDANLWVSKQVVSHAEYMRTAVHQSDSR